MFLIFLLLIKFFRFIIFFRWNLKKKLYILCRNVKIMLWENWWVEKFYMKLKIYVKKKRVEYVFLKKISNEYLKKGFRNVINFTDSIFL